MWHQRWSLDSGFRFQPCHVHIVLLSGIAPLGDVHSCLLPWLKGCYELLPVKYLWRIPIRSSAAHVNSLPWTVVCCHSLPLLITFGFCTRSRVFLFFRKNDVVLRQLLIWKKSRSRGDGRRRSRNKAGLGLGGTNWESTTGISTPPCVKQTASGELLYHAGSPAHPLCFQPRGVGWWVGLEGVARGKGYIYIYKLCKALILQLQFLKNKHTHKITWTTTKTKNKTKQGHDQNIIYSRTCLASLTFISFSILKSLFTWTRYSKTRS